MITSIYHDDDVMITSSYYDDSDVMITVSSNDDKSLDWWLILGLISSVSHLPK